MNRRLTMTRQARAYLEYRRALGVELQNAGRLLLRFAKFADRSGWSGPLTTDLVLRWLQLPKAASSSYQYTRLSALRTFARYLAARDGRTDVPDFRLAPKAFRRRPHIYGKHQIEELLRAAGRMRPVYELRPLTYQTLFGLLASTGLRISEALKLTMEQVDLERGILRIELTKFNKSRLVPLHPTVTRVMRRYAVARDCRWGSNDGMPFFVGHNGLALMYGTVKAAFRKICDDLGWNWTNGEGSRPRIHDLRHSFACRRLLRWYNEGENVHHRIAALSTYLGHSRVTDTYWYLTGTPELLAVVGSRFEQFASPTGRRLS